MVDFRKQIMRRLGYEPIEQWRQLQEQMRNHPRCDGEGFMKLAFAAKNAWEQLSAETQDRLICEQVQAELEPLRKKSRRARV